MKPVLTKWTTTHQGTKGDMAHWTCKKSIENNMILQGSNGFWAPNNAATLTYIILKLRARAT